MATTPNYALPLPADSTYVADTALIIRDANTTVDEVLKQQETEVTTAKQAAVDAAGLVGAPAGSAVLAAISDGGAARDELDATYSPLGLGKPKMIVGRSWLFAGDSHTDGTGATTGQRWASVLPDILGTAIMAAPGRAGITVIEAWPPLNFRSVVAGVGGQRSDQMLARLESDIAAAPPLAGIALLAGTNDVAQDATYETFKASMEAMIALAKSHDIPLVVGTIPPMYGSAATTARRAKIAQFNAWIRSKCAQDGIPLAEVWGYLADPATGNLFAAVNSDNIHVNNAGHKLIAEAFARAIEEISPTTRGVLTASGLGAMPNPLMTGTPGAGLPSSWVEGAGTGAAATFAIRQAWLPALRGMPSGIPLAAGQWLEVDLDAALVAGQRVVQSVIAGVLTVGHVYALCGQIEIEDLGGWDGATSSWVQLHFGSGDNTKKYASGGGSRGINVGPVFDIFTAQGTGGVLRFQVLAAAGTHVRARIGCVDLIDLTALGLV